MNQRNVAGYVRLIGRINILQWILTKLGTYLILKRVWNPIDFQGYRSKINSLGQMFRRGDTPRFALPLGTFYFHCFFMFELLLIKLESENIPEYDPSNLWVVSGERLRRPETQPYGERESE
jgi:hypothetical protein